MTIPLDSLMIIGLCMLPGAFIVALLLVLIFARWELGALAAGTIGGLVTFAAGLVVFFIGLGELIGK